MLRRILVACLAWTLMLLLGTFSLSARQRQEVEASDDAYLPLAVGKKWVLRNPREKTEIVFEATQRDNGGYRIRFVNPWDTNEWTVVPRGGRFYLTAFGKNGNLQPLPNDTLYFDFTAPESATWSNTIGSLTVITRNATVRSATRTYHNCIAIRQASTGGALLFTFAPGMGFVQFGEGRFAFVLDEAASSGLDSLEEDRPVQHVPSPTKPSDSLGRLPSRRPSPRPIEAAGPELRFAKSLVGITAAVFANESNTPQNLLKRFEQTVEAGITFMVGSGKWNEVEPRKGQYDFGGLDFQVSYAQKLNISIAYTLRLIDTVDRTMPPELSRKPWTDREMQRRVVALVEAMAPRFKDRVKWFMFGNEIDGYFARHPNELRAYVRLYDLVARRLKQLVPGIQVSSTLMYGGLDYLKTLFKPLNERFDFLAITYYPIRGDFTVQDPGVVRRDFARMREAARGRKVVLQEIGYPSSPVNRSSEEKQAQFVENVFNELRAHADTFVAGSFFLLADLPDGFVQDLAKFYGMPDAPTFLAYLQTLGMFDGNGRPKKSWEVFRREVRR